MQLIFGSSLDSYLGKQLQTHCEKLEGAIQNNASLDEESLTFAKNLFLKLQDHTSSVTINPELNSKTLAKTISLLSNYSNLNRKMEDEDASITWLDFCRDGVKEAKSNPQKYLYNNDCLYNFYENPYLIERNPKYGWVNKNPMRDFPLDKIEKMLKELKEEIDQIFNNLDKSKSDKIIKELNIDASKTIKARTKAKIASLANENDFVLGKCENQIYKDFIKTVSISLKPISKSIFYDKNFIKALKLWPQIPELKKDLKRCHVAAFMAFANLSGEKNLQCIEESRQGSIELIELSETPQNLENNSSTDIFSSPKRTDDSNSDITFTEFKTPSHRPFRLRTISASPRQPSSRPNSDDLSLKGFGKKVSLEKEVNDLGKFIESELNKITADQNNYNAEVKKELYDLKNSLETTLNTLNQIKPQNDEKGSKLNPLKKDVSELSSNFTSFQSDFKEQTLEIKNLKNLLDDTHSALDNLQKKLIHNDELDKKGEEGVLLAKVNTLSEEIDTLKNQQDEYQANLNSRMELISSSLSKICSSLEKTPGLKLKDSKNINALSAELAKNSSQIEVLKMIIEQQQRSTILRNIAIVGVALAIGYVMGKRRSTQ